MQKPAVSGLTPVLLVALSVSCTDTNRQIPTPTAPPPVSTPAPPPPAPTPFAGTGTYEFVGSPVPGRPVYPYTLTSSYVLRDNGTFTLHLAGFEFPGRYTETDGIVTFDFDWNNRRAGAKGVFSGDEMTVSYEPYMAMSDFDDAVYAKKR